LLGAFDEGYNAGEVEDVDENAFNASQGNGNPNGTQIT
jgi:hypothetical protein